MEVIEQIDMIQKDIFDFRVQLLPEQVSNLMSAIIEQGLIPLQEASKIQYFNQILQGCLQAMQNRDYLLLADLLEFKLKKLLHMHLEVN